MKYQTAMKKQAYVMAILTGSIFISACDNNNNTSSNPFLDTEFPTLERPITSPPTGVTSYNFVDKFSADPTGTSSVKYTGQIARHILINDMAQTVQSYTESLSAEVLNDLSLYLDGPNEAVDYDFSKTGKTLIPGPTYGDISRGKSLRGKIAGNDRVEHLINGKLLGWAEGLAADPTPEQLVDYLIALLETEVTDGLSPSIVTTGGDVTLDVVYVDDKGRDFSQLLQKFLLGAVTFSQGTADYLKADFAGRNIQDETDPFTESEHQWDEAFGYFAAARDYLGYTDDEIAAKGGRADYANGYHDTNGDSNIDLLSEINLGHSTNCAKRDRGTVGNTNPTDFTADAMNALLTGRKFLNDAANTPIFPSDTSLLEQAALQASTVWEKCIAATVVHYINDTISNIDAFEEGAFVNLEAYKDLAKNWSEMKGFALSLQFNPDSPFNADDSTIAAYEYVMGLMGDAPVLADGTQAGVIFEGGIETYRDDLLIVRQIFENAYAFDTENVENW